MENFKSVKKVGILGILANLFLFIIKISVGISSKSESMIADSFNSISDVFASLMTFIDNKLARNESDSDHNFGHEKAEYIFSMFISISIFVISIKLLYSSVTSLFTSHKVIYSYNLIIVSIVTIVIKLILYLYTKYLYKKEPSILIKSNSLDHRNDIFLTITVLISIIFSKYNIYFVDSLVGIIISIWFLISGISIFKESYNVLLDVALPDNIKNNIIKFILTNENVVNVEDIYSMSIGYQFIIVLTLCVDGNLNTFESHNIANSIQKKIKNNFSNVKEVFIHIHPIDIEKKSWQSNKWYYNINEMDLVGIGVVVWDY